MFSSDQWKLHPDWVYCEFNYSGSNEQQLATNNTDEQQFDSPENNMRHFLDRLSREGVKLNWGSSRFKSEIKRVCPIFSARLGLLPTCTGKGDGFTADCPKCKYHAALSYSRVKIFY